MWIITLVGGVQRRERMPWGGHRTATGVNISPADASQALLILMFVNSGGCRRTDPVQDLLLGDARLMEFRTCDRRRRDPEACLSRIFSPRDCASYGPMSVRLSFTSCGSIKTDVYGSTSFLVCRLPSS